jgi:hypothetical protein
MWIDLILPAEALKKRLRSPKEPDSIHSSLPVNSSSNTDSSQGQLQLMTCLVYCAIPNCVRQFLKINLFIFFIYKLYTHTTDSVSLENSYAICEIGQFKRLLAVCMSFLSFLHLFVPSFFFSSFASLPPFTSSSLLSFPSFLPSLFLLLLFCSTGV